MNNNVDLRIVVNDNGNAEYHDINFDEIEDGFVFEKPCVNILKVSERGFKIKIYIYCEAYIALKENLEINLKDAKIKEDFKTDYFNTGIVPVFNRDGLIYIKDEYSDLIELGTGNITYKAKNKAFLVELDYIF
jgi:acyl-CoA synthetase (AMP-forming)/AMP-acid ligase II